MFSTKRNRHNKNSTTRRGRSIPRITIKKDTRADVARAKKLPGITVSVEHVDVLGSTIRGDLVKEYKNGKLQKQVFVTKRKMKSLMSRSAARRGGAAAAAAAPAAAEKQPERIIVEEKTNIARSDIAGSAASGAGAGFGFGIGIEAAHALMGAIFGEN
jgi:hypothetical protein